MWDKVKQAATVVMFTLLIWFVADQNVEDDQAYEISVRAVAADPSKYVCLGENGVVSVRVTMKGLRRHLDKFEKNISKMQVLDAVIDSSQQPKLIDQVMPTKELLLRVKEIDESNLRIVSVNLENVRMRIDEYEVVPDVAVQPTFGDLLVTNVQCTPSKVSVRLPRFARVALLNDRMIHPNAEGLLRDKTDPAGGDRSFTGALHLTLESVAPVEIVPQEITLSCVVQSLTDRKTLKPVVVVYLVPDAVQKEFVIQSAPGAKFNLDVDVTGPRNLVQQIDARDVRGYVEVRAQDMESADQEIERPVEFLLPAGIKLAPKTPAPTVRFKLVRVTPGPEGGGD